MVREAASIGRHVAQSAKERCLPALGSVAARRAASSVDRLPADVAARCEVVGASERHTRRVAPRAVALGRIGAPRVPAGSLVISGTASHADERGARGDGGRPVQRQDWPTFCLGFRNRQGLVAAQMGRLGSSKETITSQAGPVTAKVCRMATALSFVHLARSGPRCRQQKQEIAAVRARMPTGRSVKTRGRAQSVPRTGMNRRRIS